MSEERRYPVFYFVEAYRERDDTWTILDAFIDPVEALDKLHKEAIKDKLKPLRVNKTSHERYHLNIVAVYDIRGAE